MRDYLKKGIEIIGAERIDEAKIDNLMKYLKLLTEYNAHTNLTAIRDEKEMLEKHFIDSLLLQNYIQKEDKNAMDIGTGAGFPGMVLAICNPHIKFTLMDSVGKKTKFLEYVKEQLNLENVEVINMRAEEFINDENRESYDLGLCRGVSQLPTILEYMIPFLKTQGRFLIQKSPDTGEEAKASNALEILNSTIEAEYNLNLPYCKDGRKVIIVRKIGITDKKYPRKTGIPLKRPL
ncbi:MAG: 16S rRNA (guanine(527)-N(7))-methyltransferase RsmG [Fusobacteriaceae bacterium]